MGAILIGVEKIGVLASRCKVYEILLGSAIRNGESGQAITNAQSGIVSLYTAMLQFLSCAIRIYHKNTASRTVSALILPSEVPDFVTKCNELATRVDTEIQNCERMHGRYWESKTGQQTEE